MEALITEFIEATGSGILLALFFGTFLSEDLACLTAGSLAAAGQVDLAAAIGACVLGIFVGDLMLYGAGRAFGARTLDSKFTARFISTALLNRGAEWFCERGATAILVSRFASGLRLPTYLAAGAFRMDARRFVVFVAIAAAVWTPLLVGAAAVWQMAVPGGAIIGLIAGFLLLRFGFRMTDPKKRRLARGRMQRVLRWEFWPLWVFYAPVVAYVVVIALRFRGLTFTAANPAIPAGGFVGESKDEIYKLINRSGAARLFTLRHFRITSDLDPDTRFNSASRFMDVNGISFPIVVKPDAGARGDGVTVTRNDVELRNALSAANGDVLIQEFFDGIEASVFYCRRPSEIHGRIFSITEKSFPSVTGDGISTLEELILQDDRAYITARKYFERNVGWLRSVPELGERVRLVDIGSHSKGAIFLDGERLRTPELDAKIDKICRGIPGFHFGRFDIRAKSFDDLKRGANFRIIELNGVTSESTNIYDPRYTLFDAYRVLFAQWRLAFEIGAENVRLGTRATTLWDLASLIFVNMFPGRSESNVRPIHRIS